MVPTGKIKGLGLHTTTTKASDMETTDSVALEAVINSLKLSGLSWPHGDRQILKGLIRIYFGDIADRLIAELEKVDENVAKANRTVESLQVPWRKKR